MNRAANMTLEQIILAVLAAVAILFVFIGAYYAWDAIKQPINAANCVKNPSSCNNPSSSVPEEVSKLTSEEVSVVASAPVVTSTQLSGDLQERAVAAAKEAGLDRKGAETVLKLIAQESSFKHCCVVPNKNTAKTGCSASTDLFCDENRLLVSYDGSSMGIMQLNKRAHPVWFTTSESNLCSDPRYRLDCKIKTSAGCNGQTAQDLDCNLRMGIRYLAALKNVLGKGKSFNCLSVHETYYGWDAALRAYNGWGCVDVAQSTYVSDVNNRDISRYSNILNAAYG